MDVGRALLLYWMLWSAWVVSNLWFRRHPNPERERGFFRGFAFLNVIGLTVVAIAIAGWNALTIAIVAILWLFASLVVRNTQWCIGCGKRGMRLTWSRAPRFCSGCGRQL